MGDDSLPSPRTKPLWAPVGPDAHAARAATGSPRPAIARPAENTTFVETPFRNAPRVPGSSLSEDYARSERVKLASYSEPFAGYDEGTQDDRCEIVIRGLQTKHLRTIHRA